MEVSDRIFLGDGWYRLWGLSFLVACLPSTLAYDSAPIPPTPFPSGEGGDQGYFRQGASPLASPGLDGMRHWVCLRKAGCGGGACRLCCLPPLSLAYFAAPLPRRGRISPRPALAERSSRREGGNQGYFMQGASPLASPGLGGMRHWVCLWKAGYGGGLARAALGHGGRSCVRRGACLLGRLPTLPGTFSFFIPISRQEDRAQTIGLSQYSIFGKSSGGSGGLFQESPSVLPSVLPVPSAKAVRRERVRERPSRCMTV